MKEVPFTLPTDTHEDIINEKRTKVDVSMQKEVKKGKDLEEEAGLGRRSRIVDRSFSPYIPVCRVMVFQAKGPRIALEIFHGAQDSDHMASD